MFGFLTTRLCHCQRRFEYQQYLFIVYSSYYFLIIVVFMTNLYHAIDKSLVLPRILLSFREVEAFIRGCYVPVANWRNESSKTNLDQNDAVAVWATLETVFYFLF